MICPLSAADHSLANILDSVAQASSVEPPPHGYELGLLTDRLERQYAGEGGTPSTADEHCRAWTSSAESTCGVVVSSQHGPRLILEQANDTQSRLVFGDMAVIGTLVYCRTGLAEQGSVVMVA